MAQEASEEAIATLLGLGLDGLTREDAAQLLKVSDFDVGNAANKYFDKNGDIVALRALWEHDYSNMRWDGSAFGADRYGQADSHDANIPTFNIECAPDIDDYPTSGIPSGAPSRPPSRTSQRSFANTPQQSVEHAQESGVIGGSKPFFGPATRDYYEDNNWALVPTTSSAEVIPDPDADNRKREEKAPATIKPLATDDYLPALITILHAIPLYRNAFLAPSITQGDYWMGDEWWKGSALPPARTMETSDMETIRDLELVHETQRLMGFLDKTDRAYGSVATLLELDAMKEPKLPVDDQDQYDLVLRFLLNWGIIYNKLVPDLELNGVLRSSFIANNEEKESYKLDINVFHEDAPSERTLYDLLDDLLFFNVGGSAHIMNISNVLILKLSSMKMDATGLNCKIPATFYADRYLYENKQAVDNMLSEMKICKEEIETLDNRLDKLKWHKPRQHPVAERLDALQMLKTSLRAFQPMHRSVEEDAKNAETLARLQNTITAIERKIATLEDEKKKAQETLDRISNRFKAPLDAPAEDTMDVTNESASDGQYAHPYQLCGVSTDPKVVYVLQSDTRSEKPSPREWWCIRYETGYPSKVSSERVALDEVLRAASSGYKSAILIYANDAATSVPPAPLSSALQNFVKRDNLTFLKELQEAQSQNEWTTEPGTGVAQGDWAGDYGDGWNNEDQWNSMSAKQFHDQADSTLSSTTLTPNTEIGDDGAAMEMQEVNGGISAWAGVSSSASSDTVGADAMDIVEIDDPRPGAPPATVDLRDVEMGGAGATNGREEPRVQHIEVVEKKGP
ncbi:hypothetical protein BS50DRAFT_570359 [Corynespora cassiicola Philippines]|uniref:UBA domain-containing protein n=1 Tax=Corynespora cassiicola Philippines TaxID=1448308 RepID=A0A2T2P0R3_CORCC|nr:hypothetical protein BS50DRAFT_570359 [Corynespora cassiicola Philippines]